MPATARLRSSWRHSGPGTDYDTAGFLEAGDEVTVTEEAGKWMRIEAPGGREASGSAQTTPALNLQPNCAGSAGGSACWKEVANEPGCHFWTSYPFPGWKYAWSGKCATGVVIGEGTLSASNGSVTHVLTGTFDQG